MIKRYVQLYGKEKNADQIFTPVELKAYQQKYKLGKIPYLERKLNELKMDVAYYRYIEPLGGIARKEY